MSLASTLWLIDPKHQIKFVTVMKNDINYRFRHLPIPSFTFWCTHAQNAVELFNTIRKTVQKKEMKKVEGFHRITSFMSSMPAWLNCSLIPVWPFRHPNGCSSAHLTHRFCCSLVQNCVMERMTVPASDQWLFVFLAQRYRIIRRRDGAPHIWETRFTDRIREEVNACREGSHVSLSVWMNLCRDSLDGRWSVLESRSAPEKTAEKNLCFGSLFSQNVSVIYNWDLLLILGGKCMEIQIWARANCQIPRWLFSLFWLFFLSLKQLKLKTLWLK